MSLLKQRRLALGISVDALASAAGIGAAAYWDLETHEHELAEALSLVELAKLATALRTIPSALFGAVAPEKVPVETLAHALRQQLVRKQESVAAFEDRVGWDVAAAIEQPDLFADFNADGLRAICAEVGVNWLGVIDGVQDDLRTVQV